MNHGQLRTVTDSKGLPTSLERRQMYLAPELWSRLYTYGKERGLTVNETIKLALAALDKYEHSN